MTENSRLVIEGVFVLLVIAIASAVSLYSFVLARRKAPTSWQEMEDRYDRQQKRNEETLQRLDAAWQRIDQLETEIDDVRDERDADHELIQSWITYARKTATQLREVITMFEQATGQKPPLELHPEPSSAPRRRTGRVALTRFIEQRFSVDEIDELAFEMGLAADQLSGDTRGTRARSLVQWAGDHSQLPELRRRVEAARPQHL
jgi:septal ring factor EnvC (AmiA/AmiB activator)